LTVSFLSIYFKGLKVKIVNDNEIKTMLARLQQDLSDPSAPMAEWTHAEFIPLDERKKNVKILNTGYWLGNAAMVAGSAYSCLTIFAGATFMQLVLIGLVSFLILASTFSWYKYVLPVVLKREYKLTQYKINFKNGENNPKFEVGPTAPSPGPMLLNVASTALKAVIKVSDSQAVINKSMKRITE